MSFELDPLRRIRVLQAAIPGAAVVEGVLDAPFDAVWEAATAFEHVGAIEVVIKESRILSRTPDADTGGERLELEITPRPFGAVDLLEADVRPGWCWMQSRWAIAAMAAAPEGEATRFAHLEALRVPGARLTRPFVTAKMKLVRELSRFEREAQRRTAS